MYQTEYLKCKSQYLELKAQQSNQLGGAPKKTYYIHDNGGRPFQCIIESNKINIYGQTGYDEKSNKVIYDKKALLSFNPNKIFVGKSPKNEMTKFSGGHGPKFDGNTILLEMGNNECIYVGSEIWSFTTKDCIAKYISPVGNNDVPYPYAIDKSKNIYLITQGVVLKHSDDIAKNLAKYDNPVDYYYDYHLMTPDRGTIPQMMPKVDTGIDKWFVGKSQYTMTYSEFPEKDYDRLVKQDKGKMYIVDKKGKKTQLAKKDYIKLMDDFGKSQSFEPLPRKKTYADRDMRGSLMGFYLSVVGDAIAKGKIKKLK